MTEDFTAKGKAAPAVFVDAKPKRKRTRKVKPASTPGHEAAAGYSSALVPSEAEGVGHRITPQCAHLHNELLPDMGKSAEQMAAPATNYGNPVSTADFNAHRVSESLGRAQGHQDCSSGDHGPGQGRSTDVAVGHRDLRQSNVSFGDVLARLRTVRGNTVDLGVSDRTAGGFSHAGEVALASFDAANQSGQFQGMQSVNHNPLRPDYHQSRGSGTNPNGSHSSSSQARAVSTAVSGKSETALDIMKRTQRVYGT